MHVLYILYMYCKSCAWYISCFLEQVPADGETMGEVMMRGNMVMKGYLDNDSANSKDLKGGCVLPTHLGAL